MLVSSVYICINMTLAKTVLEATIGATINTNVCPCDNSGICKLNVDYNLIAPSPTGPQEAITRFVANQIGSLEDPWVRGDSAPDNRIRNVSSMTRNHKLWYNKHVIGMLSRDTVHKVVYMVFRGTAYGPEGMKDLQYGETTASMLPNATKMHRNCSLHSQHVLAPGLLMHGGFNDIYTSFKKEVEAYLVSAKDAGYDTLIVGGHSLGAGIAQVSIFYTTPKMTTVRGVVFGAPRAGNNVFASFVGGRLTNVVNDTDIITAVPVSCMPNLESPCKPYLYETAGTVVRYNLNLGSLYNNHKMSTYISLIS